MAWYVKLAVAKSAAEIKRPYGIQIQTLQANQASCLRSLLSQVQQPDELTKTLPPTQLDCCNRTVHRSVSDRSQAGLWAEVGVKIAWTHAHGLTSN